MKRPSIPQTALLAKGHTPRIVAAMTVGMLLAASAVYAAAGSDLVAPATGTAAVKPAAKATTVAPVKRSKAKARQAESVVVTGSLIPQRTESGKSLALIDPSLQIIDRKTIERSGASDLRRLLTRTVAGAR